MADLVGFVRPNGYDPSVYYSAMKRYTNDAFHRRLSRTDCTGELYAYNRLGWLTESRIPVSMRGEEVLYRLTEYQYNSKTYQNGDKLERRINKDVDKLTTFNGRDWGNTSIQSGDIKKRILLMVLPDVTLSKSQTQAINDSIQYAKSKGVEIQITVGIEK